MRLCSLLAVLTLAACSKKLETPPPVLAMPSADAAPPPVDPEIVCRDQRSSRVTLHGSGFAAVPFDIPGQPRVALPSVELTRTRALDGESIDEPERVTFSGDPEADPTNAVDEDGDLLEVDGEPLLMWASQEEMSFHVTQDLVLGERGAGEDSRERGALPEGVWDVAVRNPDGVAASSIGSLAVIAAPSIEALAADVVCLQQGARTIVLSGRTFLRNEDERTVLAVDGVEERFDAELSNCEAIAHDGLDAELCRTATIELGQDSIAVGYPRLTLENPETAACASEQLFELRVLPAPHIDRVAEPLSCIADGARTFVIEGESFVRIDESVPTVTIGELEVAIDSMTCEAMTLPAGMRSVELCSSISFTLEGDDLPAGLYDVSVVNPDGEPRGCASRLSGAIRIAAPPSITELDPSYVCLADSAQEVTIAGEDFLVVDGVVPLVELAGEALDPADVRAQDCEPLETSELEVQRCAGLVITLAEGETLLSPDVRVVNPAPAGCSDEASDVVTIVPRPAIASATPQPICNAQGDDVVVITGTGFLELDGELPSVAIGGVAPAALEATGASCEAIEGRSDARVCTELVALIAQGTLATGLHDVVVRNTPPADCETQDAIELAVVAAPTIAAVTPDPICLAQGSVEVTITGTGFVRIDTEQPAVSFGDAATSVAATGVTVTEASCTAITSDSVVCTELTATLAMDALALGGPYRVSVENPSSAACTSEEVVELDVIAPPSIASIDAATVCTGGGTIAITGANLTGATGRLVDPDTQAVVEAINTVVNDTGTSAVITFGAGVLPDTYELQVSGAHGCSDGATQTITAAIGPVAFFMDPPVAYSGVALRGTLYASGVAAVPLSVTLTPEGGGAAVDEVPLTSITWPAGGSMQRIGATIPAGIDEGVYDVTVDFAGSCDTLLSGGLVVEDDITLALETPALDPRFGEQNIPLAVTVLAKAEAALGAGEVNFEPTPRAYLSSAALATAQPLRATQLDSEERLTAVVPDGLAAGLYDLVVVNPDGSVGFQADAFEATAVAPPVIDALAPTQLDNDIDRPITIAGGNFFNPTADMAVTLECLASGATVATTVGPLAIDNASTATSLIATVTSSALAHGTICVVRVTNTVNGTFDQQSAIAITNKASKLPAFSSGSALTEGRRAPATAFGEATREARFLYAIGGDDGTVANAKVSVEAAPVGRFGVLGAFRTVATELPAGITQAHAVSGGRYIYVLGGLSGNPVAAPIQAIHRAAVLKPDEAPAITDIDLRFFAGPIDADPSTREGLAPGALHYVVAAVFGAMDTDNPGGESLPSETLTLHLPDVPEGVEIELTWDAVLGADGVTEASSYRIYRTAGPDSTIATLALLAEVAAPTRSFIDQNPAAFLDASKEPLTIGDLGEWRALPAGLNTARAAYGVAVADDPSCASYLYVIGGRTGVASESATYEYATFDTSTGALGAFTEATGVGMTARREHAVFVADGATSAFINPAMGTCESYVYASSGFSGGTSFVTTLQEAQVQAGGALGAFTSALASGGAPQQFAGHAAFFSSDGAYAMLGAGSTTTPPTAINVAQQAELSSGTVPDFGNFSSASGTPLVARYLPGFAREGALFYVIGGADSTGAALSSTERNAR
jgi:hypothetical protein